MEGAAEPSESMMKSLPYYKLLVLSAIIGVVAAVVVASFFWIVDNGQDLLWVELPKALGQGDYQDSPVLIISLCLIGGLLVGLITHFSKVKPVILQEELKEFNDDGRISPKKGIVGMIRGLVALLFGGSIGPEGPLVGGTAGLGTWLTERRKVPKQAVSVATYAGISGMFGAFLGSPFASSVFTIEMSMNNKKNIGWLIIIPGIVASTAAYAVFYTMTGFVFGSEYTFPPYDGLENIQLLYAIFLGLLGGAIGIFTIFLYRQMKRLAEPWTSKPIPLALLAGLILGLVGSVFPLALFDGAAEIQTIINDAVELGIAMLLALALVKIILLCVCLSMGWTGGYIFPSFFIGASVGLAVHLAFPFIPEVVCMVCLISGVAVALLRSPMALALIVAMMFQLTLTPVIAIAIVSSFILTLGTSMVVEKEGIGPGYGLLGDRRKS